MAAIQCGLCEEEGAVLMYVVMENGDTMGVGQSCLAGFALGQAASFSAGLTPELCEAYGAQFDAIAANDKRNAAVAVSSGSGPTKSVVSADTATPADTPDAGHRMTQTKPTCPECGSTTPNHDGDGIWDCDKCGATFKTDGTYVHNIIDA